MPQTARQLQGRTRHHVRDNMHHASRTGTQGWTRAMATLSFAVPKPALNLCQGTERSRLPASQSYKYRGLTRWQWVVDTLTDAWSLWI